MISFVFLMAILCQHGQIQAHINEIHCVSYQQGVKKVKKAKEAQKVKKAKKARVPESSKAQPIPGQYQGPAAPDHRIPTPDNATWPHAETYSSKY